ncbi:MAG: hypothetical protein M1816_003452 [Peltula sp. TS41687]|nr:MAG: hypothetical protein M1816_003452 [Peltula sp. TS41687]
MLLSLGLTADAAAAHRHEFSTSIPSSSPKGTAPRTRPSSARLPIPLGLEMRRRPVTEAPGASLFQVSQMQRKSLEEECDSLSESEGSRAFSSDGLATPPTEAWKPNRRPKTSYHLAHPPPSFINRQRLLIRPRLLLQLQRTSESARPSPALDVLPSTICPPRLARRFPAFFRGKDRLGPDDLVIVSSEDYGSSTAADSNDTEDTDAEISESRHVVATICQRRKEDGGVLGKVDICLKDGPVWEGTPLSNGGYEFNAMSNNGLRTTARWVRHPFPSRRRSDAVKKQVPHVAGKGEKRLGFSLLNPDVRRHPFIGSLTRSSIDIFDTYPASVPSTTVHTPLATPNNFSATSFFDSSSFELDLKQTDEDLRTLILITGIWVAFREGWCTGFKLQSPMSPVFRSTPTAPATSGTSPRSSSSAPFTKESNSRSGHSESPLKLQGLETHTSHSKTPRLASTSEQKTTLTPRRALSTSTASGMRPNSRRHEVDRQGVQLSSGMVSNNPTDQEPVRIPPNVRLSLNGASNGMSHGISVRSSVPGSTPKRARSVRVFGKDGPSRDYRDSGRDQQADTATTKRWGKMKRLLSLVKHGAKDR